MDQMHANVVELATADDNLTTLALEKQQYGLGAVFLAGSSLVGARNLEVEVLAEPLQWMMSNCRCLVTRRSVRWQILIPASSWTLLVGCCLNAGLAGGRQEGRCVDSVEVREFVYEGTRMSDLDLHQEYNPADDRYCSAPRSTGSACNGALL